MTKSNSENSIRKRAKELDCLYAFSNLVVKNDITVDEILQGTIDLIPPASQNPEITSARIILENQIYKTKNMKILLIDDDEWIKDSLGLFQESHPNAFKILITAYGSKELLSEAREMGIHDFIEKPFTSETIEESLSRLIYKC